MAHQSIPATAEWCGEIRSALNTMHALVVLVQPGIEQSHWCNQEIGIAVGTKKLIMAVRQGADPSGFISRFQGIPGAGQSAVQIADSIFEVLARSRKTRRQLAKGAVKALYDTNTYKESEIILEMIEKIPSASDRTIDLLEGVTAANSQVRGATRSNLPRRVEILAGKWRKVAASASTVSP